MFHPLLLNTVNRYTANTWIKHIFFSIVQKIISLRFFKKEKRAAVLHHKFQTCQSNKIFKWTYWPWSEAEASSKSRVGNEREKVRERFNEIHTPNSTHQEEWRKSSIASEGRARKQGKTFSVKSQYFRKFLNQRKSFLVRLYIFIQNMWFKSHLQQDGQHII